MNVFSLLLNQNTHKKSFLSSWANWLVIRICEEERKKDYFSTIHPSPPSTSADCLFNKHENTTQSKTGEENHKANKVIWQMERKKIEHDFRGW